MSPLKIIASVLTTLVTLLFLGWYGVFCARLGWQARDNALLSPVLPLLTGDKQQTHKKGCPGLLGENCD